MRVQFGQSYRSNAGAWDAGQVVELPDDLVEWLNHDSPGVCVPVEETEPAARQVQAPPADRMVKNARRRDRQGDPGDQGAITRADHKATRS
jgi:hypothetical protein